MFGGEIFCCVILLYFLIFSIVIILIYIIVVLVIECWYVVVRLFEYCVKFYKKCFICEIIMIWLLLFGVNFLLFLVVKYYLEKNLVLESCEVIKILFVDFLIYKFFGIV